MSFRRYSISLTIIFLLAVIITTAIRSQNTTQSSSQTQNTKDVDKSYAPIADFNAPEPTDPDKRAKRLKRAKRHNLRDLNLSSEEAARFALKERGQTSNPSASSNTENKQTSPPAFKSSKHEYRPPVIGGAVTDESAPEQPLPTHISDVVVIGEVSDAAAYLSEDKTAVFSEFTIQVNEVLKNSISYPVAPNDTVTALRPGGGVRFPSGKVEKRLVEGRGLPQPTNRYALFLKYDDLAQAYYIITGYELRGGRVFPLDSIPKYGTDKHPLALYAKYAEANEESFLEDVRQAVLNPPQQAPSGFPIIPSPPEGDAL